MSQIRKTHTGYYGVAMALAVLWYLGLGLGFTFAPHRYLASENYTLVSRLMPLSVWGPVYAVIGLGLALSATVLWVPHVFVRVFSTVGLTLTGFWLACFIASACLNKLDAFSFIPAWAAMFATEYRVIIEPERDTGRS